MKKLIAVFVALVAFTIGAVLIIQTPATCLYLLNWGEYINHDLVVKFEKEYHCQVIEENVTSSEAMYQKITSDTTAYDVAIPGDYTVRQLQKEGQLKELDVTNSEYEYLGNYETMFTDSLKEIMDTNMINDGKAITTYYMPYFWGAYSIIYSERNAEVPEVVLNNDFAALYNRDLYNSTVKIGMYNTARWIVSSYIMSLGLNPNITSKTPISEGVYPTTGDLSLSLQEEIAAALKKVKFDEFGDDALKRNVANGSLDMCFTQLGDFFDALYLVYDGGDNAKVDFNVYVPKTTAAFFDSMVIPRTTQNYDLANQFINFMLNPDNAYENAMAIGYCPTLKEVCEDYRRDASAGEYYYEAEEESNSLTLSEFLTKYPMYLDPINGCENVYLLEPKSNEYLTTCEMIYNNLA